MDQNLLRSDLLPATIPAAALWLLALATFAAWLAVRSWAARRWGRESRRRFLAAFVAGAVAWWALLQAVGRIVLLSSPCPVALAATIAAAALEAVSSLYARDCSRVSGGAVRRAIVALRMSAVVIVVFALLRPVAVGERTRAVRRRVVVLTDDSASMHVPDSHRTESERAEAVQALGADNPAVGDGATRADFVRALLGKRDGGGETPLSRLAKKYDVLLWRFGASATPVGDVPSGQEPDGEKNGLAELEDSGDAGTGDGDGERHAEAAFRSATDLAGALETVVSETPFEELAGIVVLTDGIVNGETSTDAVARRLGAAGVPVHFIVVGGSLPARDASISDAAAPESVFLGDKVRIAATVSATELAGRQFTLRLFLERPGVRKGTPPEELEVRGPVSIDSADFHREFRFAHVPESKGVLRYRVRLDPVDGEERPENNEFALDVSVSDDRTNVLLVDDRPRWEFRYLRNLFYGRDKSVHLQEYLVHPDNVAPGATSAPPDSASAPLPPASARRHFGDSESGSLPVSRAEWRAFDVIILGDVGDDELAAHAADIRYCVEERGALLVLICGPRAMPHRVGSPDLRALMPLETELTDESWIQSPEPTFRVRLAPDGRGHPVMSLSASNLENEGLWDSLRPFDWRHPVKGVAPGAEMLAYAEDEDAQSPEAEARRAAAEMFTDPAAAAARLSELRESMRRSAVAAAAAHGRGKVLMLATDQSWRLRYRVGDTLHHRFWGQILRWGAGEKLRAGNSFVRLGTDMLRYAPGENVRIFGRFQDSESSPLQGLKPHVAILDADGSVLRTADLEPRPDSNGFYEADLGPLWEPGDYFAQMVCPAAERRLGQNWPTEKSADELKTRFFVVTGRRPGELSALRADRAVPRAVAAATGGSVFPATGLADALADFGEGRKLFGERSELPLWSSGWLFFLLAAALSVEWTLRKKSNLN